MKIQRQESSPENSRQNRHMKFLKGWEFPNKKDDDNKTAMKRRFSFN